MPLTDNTKLFRIGGGNIDNLRLKSAELKLDPVGISLIRANSMDEAAKIMKEAYPNAINLHKLIDEGKISEINAKSIREAGFDVIHNPTKGIGDAHARLIHPDGVSGFNDNNLKKLSKKFKCP